MKSSTLHRSNLSKERIALLEETVSGKQRPYTSSPSVYSRADKEKELDLLWQSFKVNQKEERTPSVYLTTGFVAGALSMFLVMSILNFGHSTADNIDLNLWQKNNIAAVPVTVSTFQDQTIKTKKYVIQSGDTLESVVLRFYGTYDIARVRQIQEINNISNPNRIAIGQEIIVPIEM